MWWQSINQSNDEDYTIINYFSKDYASQNLYLLSIIIHH